MNVGMGWDARWVEGCVCVCVCVCVAWFFGGMNE